jgi:PAS domain S-box-containing protein
VRLSITAIRDARGEVTGYLGVAHDLTARREAERFAALLMEHSPSAFLLVDVDGKIMSATPRAAELFGYGPTELVGRLVHELVPAAVRAQHVARVASFVRNGHSMRLGTHLEFPGVHRDGRSLYVDLGITPVSLPQGPGVLVSAVDVTARRAQAQRAETQLAVMRHLSRSVDEASAIRTTLTEVATRLGWTWAAFWRLEPSAKRLELAEHWSAQPLLELAQKSRATPLATDAGLPPAAWTPGGAVWKANLSTDASFGRARVARECGMRSLALFRVTVEGELVGAIEFAADAPRARDESVVEMMESIGTALGQFVIRSRAEAALLEARRIGETANER